MQGLCWKPEQGMELPTLPNRQNPCEKKPGGNQPMHCELRTAPVVCPPDDTYVPPSPSVKPDGGLSWLGMVSQLQDARFVQSQRRFAGDAKPRPKPRPKPKIKFRLPLWVDFIITPNQLGGPESEMPLDRLIPRAPEPAVPEIEPDVEPTTPADPDPGPVCPAEPDPVELPEPPSDPTDI